MMEESNDFGDFEEEADEEVALDEGTLEIEGIPCTSSTSATDTSRHKSARKSLANCVKCKRSYYSMDGYKSHLKGHLFEEFYNESAPDRNTFLAHCQEAAKKILHRISEVSGHTGIAPECAKIASFLLSHEDCTNKFVDLVSSEIYQCFPSPSSSTPIGNFQSVYVKNVHAMQSSELKREIFINFLKGIVPFESSDMALQWIVGTFPMRLSLAAEVFILKCIREPRESNIQPTNKDRDDDPRFCQSVYYVGGSAVKSVLRLGGKSSSPTWAKVITCVSDKFLLDSNSSRPSEDVTAWTAAVDRGGLKYINESVWMFFMALTIILKDIEDETGSVPHEKVMAKVEEDAIMVLWDDIIEDSLSVEDSNFLLTKLCYFFVNTWGVGVQQRRKNEIAECVRDKIPFRSSLLPRK